MTANVEHAYSELVYAHLAQAVTSTATAITLQAGELYELLKNWTSGKYIYVTLVDLSGNVEVVKITAMAGDTLTVERGQDGTTARAWTAGTLVTHRLVAVNLNSFMQKGVFRSITYNPNGALSPAYPGEEVYQSNNARWWKQSESNKWRLIAGQKLETEFEDEDGYIWYMPIWVNYSDPNYWTPSNITWDPANEWWETDFNTEGELVAADYPAGGPYWYDELGQPVDARISVYNKDGAALNFNIDCDAAQTHLDTSPENDGVPHYWCNEIRPLIWPDPEDRIYLLGGDNRAAQWRFRVFFNTGSPYSFDYTWLNYTNQSYWTPSQGTWNAGGWWDVGGGVVNWDLDLSVNGAWANGFHPVRVKVTFNMTRTHSTYFQVYRGSTKVREVTIPSGVSEYWMNLCNWGTPDDMTRFRVYGVKNEADDLNVTGIYFTQEEVTDV